METDIFTIEADDDVRLTVYSWMPDDKSTVKGIVQIAHGMAEHAARYEAFAVYMVKHGYAVFANDHRGHGKTAGAMINAGYIGGGNSWRTVLGDMHLLNKYIKALLPGNKIVLLGHSMGSFYARAYLDIFASTISGVIISGTAWYGSSLLSFGLEVAKFQCMLLGKRNHSKLLDTLSFGSYNTPFKPNKTPFDWLSRDENVCRLYTADPYCGFVCTSSFYRELFRLLMYVQRKDLYENLNNDFPILILSGKFDPVGEKGEGPKQVETYLKKKWFTNVTMQLYDGGRHEMLNEINKIEVWEELTRWLARKVS